MKITQTDIAALADEDVMRLALAAEGAQTAGGVLASFWQAMAAAAVDAMRERRRIAAHLEQDLIDLEDADLEGGIVPDVEQLP